MSLLNQIQRTASADYKAFLDRTLTSEMFGDTVLLYGVQDIEERNATYEVQSYLPGWFSIGDDSGGRAFLMRLDSTPVVYRCDYGALGSIDPETVADAFGDWFNSECPVHDN